MQQKIQQECGIAKPGNGALEEEVLDEQ